MTQAGGSGSVGLEPVSGGVLSALPSSRLHQLWTATQRTGTRSGTLPFTGEPPRPHAHGPAYPARPWARSLRAEPAARAPVTPGAGVRPLPALPWCLPLNAQPPMDHRGTPRRAGSHGGRGNSADLGWEKGSSHQ